MKKNYEFPTLEVCEIEPLNLLTASMEEGETGESGTGSGEGDPSEGL